jgi:enoyl-CoA hydratase/carnithine racemase
MTDALLLRKGHDELPGLLADVWHTLRGDPDARVVVLTGRGTEAFCVGIDRSDIPATKESYSFDPLTYEDPGRLIGPRSQGLWKPVIAAVNGMACGGAFYLLGESDIILAAEHATFFDPHVTYSMAAVFEPALLLSRMPFGDLMRMTLTGADERISAARAREFGLVSDVFPAGALLSGALALAGIIADQPPAAVQASLRSLWAARQMSSQQFADVGNLFLNLATSQQELAEGQTRFRSGSRKAPRIR